MSIPKKIHFCWMSGDPYPDDIQRCIDSWHKYMPDYEYKLWDKNTFDSSKWRYTSEALSKKKYAFVSDVVRLYALYTEGGIYLDSDIEVYKSFDPLLDNPAFSGIESGGRLAAWMMASEAGNPLFKELLSYYDDKVFLSDDGSMDLTPNTIPTTRILSDHGMVHRNELQKLDNITIYPEDYFCPKNPWTGKVTITDNTYAMHLFAGAWNDTASDDLSFFGSVSDYVANLFSQNKIKVNEPCYVFGTGTVGNLALEALRMNGAKIAGFIVSKRDTAWKDIDGIPILEVAECDENVKKSDVLISVLPKGQKNIYEVLKKNGFTKLICIGE